ncbi:MAG: hypothetical protein COY40_06630 [Alphaproteobacteria bacterium CG_4_10_14_0_8_um_filter_53_9]|nr:MAG: hypothetical protein COY40_06630 [Alphaproteobacteria bacterium CG_4_10_14_0_8_um_filter_53_9]
MFYTSRMALCAIISLLALALTGCVTAKKSFPEGIAPPVKTEGSGTKDKETVCLADALHYEAIPSVEGMASVATVIFARAESGNYGGKGICPAVYAYKVKLKKKWSDWRWGRNPKGGGTAQFSYVMEGHPWPWEGSASAKKKWKTLSLPLAKKLIADWRSNRKTVAPTIQAKLEDCDHYHATYVAPKWRHGKGMKKCAGGQVIAGHHFYNSVLAFFEEMPSSAGILAIEELLLRE